MPFGYQAADDVTTPSRVLLAASYGQMGLVEEARAAWREALRVNPNYSLERRREVLPCFDRRSCTDWKRY